MRRISGRLHAAQEPLQRVERVLIAGVPWARIGEAVGHDDITTTSRVYAHVLTDEQEVDYVELLREATREPAPSSSRWADAQTSH